jgi:transposase
MEPMTTYSPEMRERALRMLAEAAPNHPNRWTAIRHVAGLLGISPETPRLWQRKVEVDAGERPGVTSETAEEIKRLKREDAQLRRANEF